MTHFFNSSSLCYPNRSSKPKLLVAGSFMSGANAGDQAALIAVMQLLERLNIPLALEVLSSGSSQFHNFENYYFLDELNESLVKYLYQDARLLLVIGGGAFFKVSTLVQLDPFIRQLKMKTALFCIGTDYDPNASLEHTEKIKSLLSQTHYLSTRSHYSQQVCRQLGVEPTESKPIGDLVHIMDTMPSFLKIGEGFSVGVNLTGLWGDDRLYQHMADLLDLLVVAKKAKIFFVPFSVRHSPDTQSHEQVLKRMKHQDRCQVIQRYFYPPHLQDLISQMNLMIGMRLHSLVMAYNVQVPFAAIDYHPKVSGFLENVGAEYACLFSGNTAVPSFYGYSKPDVYPSAEESFQKIEFVLKTSPSVPQAVKRAQVEKELTKLFQLNFSF